MKLEQDSQAVADEPGADMLGERSVLAARRRAPSRAPLRALWFHGRGACTGYSMVGWAVGASFTTVTYLRVTCGFTLYLQAMLPLMIRPSANLMCV